MANVWLLTERQKVIDQYLRCAANLYGHITPRAFLVLFNRYNEQKLLKAELMKYWNKLMRQADRNYVLYDNAIISTRLHSDKIDETIFFQQGKSFYIPGKEELLKYEKDSYYEKNEFTVDFFNHLIKEIKVNPMIAEILVSKLAWLIRIDEPMQVLLDVVSNAGVIPDNLAQVNILMGKLQKMHNNTRKWANCGHTPLEVR